MSIATFAPRDLFSVAMRARRCCLSVPARPARKLEKAAGIGADELILDLEDSVPPELKLEARAAVAEALREGAWKAASVSVRVNGFGTPWLEDDLVAIGSAGERLASVVVPKVESAAELTHCAELLERGEKLAGRHDPIGIQALIESAAGLQACAAIAKATPRLEALILGPADMSVSLGFPSPEEGPRWDFVRGAIVVAARAAELQAIDGPYLRISDLEGMRASAACAREFGFDGKWALHPDQIEPLEAVFSARPEELTEARAILEALDAGGADGAVLLDGEMLDEASRKRAELTLARAAR